MFVALTLECGHLKRAIKDVTLFVSGLYLAMRFPGLYRVAMMMWLADLIPRPESWAAMKWIRRVIQDVHFGEHFGFRQQLLLLAWFPMTLSWSTVVRTVLSAVLVPTLGVVLMLHSANEGFNDIVEVALHIHQTLTRDFRPPAVASASVLLFWFLPLPLSIFLVLVLSGLTALVFELDDELRATCRNLENLKPLKPRNWMSDWQI